MASQFVLNSSYLQQNQTRKRFTMKKNRTLWITLAILWAIVPTEAQQLETSKTIPEMVREQGNISMGGASEDPSVPDLASLIGMSKIVVKGRITAVKSHLTEDQMAIWTDFTVQVLDILYNVTLSDVPKAVTVSLVGGRMKFPEGTAEFSNSDYPISSHPKLGQVYVFFLTTSLQHLAKYSPVGGGSQGAYHIVGEKIVPAAGPEHLLSTKNQGKDRSAFESEIKAEIEHVRRPK